MLYTIDPQSMSGKLKGNPFHEACMKVARAVGLDFSINCVYNRLGEIIRIIGGNLDTAFAAAVEVCFKTLGVKIEEKVDALNLSSLVVPLGGFGAAYPAIVSPDMADQHIVNAAVEEWAHQYLAFKPLGSLYLIDSLGLRQQPDIIVMNETLAGMIAQEIGDEVYERYYPDT